VSDGVEADRAETDRAEADCPEAGGLPAAVVPRPPGVRGPSAATAAPDTTSHWPSALLPDPASCRPRALGMDPPPHWASASPPDPARRSWPAASASRSSWPDGRPSPVRPRRTSAGAVLTGAAPGI